MAAALLVVGLWGCAATPPSAPGPARSGGPLPAISVDDIRWLDRLTFGADSASLAELARRGRAGYLARQLAPGRDALPAGIATRIQSFDVSHVDVTRELVAVRRERERLRNLKDPDAQAQARKALNERGTLLARQAAERLVLESVYSRDQLQEQMVWFWLNHFSVYQQKANLRWLVGDYEATAIRPHALGHFRDLVLATLKHPAMLEYLDNAQNAQGHLNENYARELMELHTLGVDGGYTQKDVQELARVLTGVGVWNGAERPRMRREWQALYRRDGAMEFLPRRHDFGAKTFLGQPITHHGFAEVEEAVDRLVRSPACARYISRKLAVYFVSDAPPPALVDRLAATFQRTDGDLRVVLGELLRAPEFEAALGTRYRDPYQYVVGAMRLVNDGRPMPDAEPMVRWLKVLDEAPFGRQTPDGYPLVEAAWTSSGQLERRFETARAIAGRGAAPAAPAVHPGDRVERLDTSLYAAALEPRLSAATREALAAATSAREWNTLLLASPEFNDR